MRTGSFGMATNRGEGLWQKVRSEATGSQRSPRLRGRQRLLRLRLSRRRRRDRLKARRVRRNRAPRHSTIRRGAVSRLAPLCEQPFGAPPARRRSLWERLRGRPGTRFQMPVVRAIHGPHAHALFHGQRGPTEAESQCGRRCDLQARTQQMGLSRRLSGERREAPGGSDRHDAVRVVRMLAGSGHGAKRARIPAAER